MPDAPPIDFSRLAFPTDALTVAAVRAAHPRRFAADRPDFAEVAATMATERMLARRAYEKELGRPDPYPDDGFSRREALVGALTAEYKSLGLSAGATHTRELVRAVEAAATAQAREHLGRGR